MKTSLTVLLVISFAVIAVIGVFGMHAGMQNHDGNCIAATAQGTDCPKQVSPIDYLIFHLDAFRSFSTATFSNGPFASLLLLSLLVVGIGLRMLHGNLFPPKLHLAYYLYRPELFSSHPKYELLRWLALHENSPATP